MILQTVPKAASWRRLRDASYQLIRFCQFGVNNLLEVDERVGAAQTMTVDKERRRAAHRSVPICVGGQVIGVVRVIRNKLLILMAGHTFFKGSDIQPKLTGVLIIGCLVEDCAFLIVQAGLIIK